MYVWILLLKIEFFFSYVLCTIGEYIYVFGGVESSSKHTSDKVEMINIIGNVSEVCTKMPVPVAGCTSIVIVPEKDASCLYISFMVLFS